MNNMERFAPVLATLIVLSGVSIDAEAAKEKKKPAVVSKKVDEDARMLRECEEVRGSVLDEIYDVVDEVDNLACEYKDGKDDDVCMQSFTAPMSFEGFKTLIGCNRAYPFLDQEERDKKEKPIDCVVRVKKEASSLGRSMKGLPTVKLKGAEDMERKKSTLEQVEHCEKELGVEVGMLADLKSLRKTLREAIKSKFANEKKRRERVKGAIQRYKKGTSEYRDERKMTRRQKEDIRLEAMIQ